MDMVVKITKTILKTSAKDLILIQDTLNYITTQLASESQENPQNNS